MPAAGEETDLAEFIRAGGTCYLLADERRAATLAPVMSAFTDELIETAKHIADTMPGGRLDPPLGLFLDEVANIVPLPQLSALMSFAGDPCHHASGSSAADPALRGTRPRGIRRIGNGGQANRRT